MGGVTIVIVICGFMLLTDDVVMQRFAFVLAAVAAVGLWDDLKDLPSLIRLLIHLLASAFALVFVIAAEPLPYMAGAEALPYMAGAGAEALPWWIVIIAVVALAWFVNLYNFMDGIDGIAAAQCLVFCVGVQVVAGIVPGTLGQLVWLLSGATLAFLAFNWPPARIFMGDVGSGFLGLLIGTLALHLAVVELVPLVASLILLAVFWFDATYTLCVRMATRQRFTQAHRSHLYQRLAAVRGHLWTTIAYLGYAFFWLMPLAWLSTNLPKLEFFALFLAIVPLAIMCWRFRAGAASPP
jgi:Fuc2NAc and GlcNAc transferase